ncbi:YqzK family protein [Siminovitchia sp. 179-K 8D1 HS]|uniref:YqzK family protein n=1 Tax=Siminovitchia sp. 179-K 8D1 HS TaxID=3142385 RepID=UPI0039A02C1E
MGSFLKMIFGTIRVFLLFAACTILFYYGMILISQEYENYRRYDEPEGTAIKVIQQGGDQKSGWFSRLMLFYLNGE